MKAKMAMLKKILHTVKCSFDSANGRVGHVRRDSRVGMADIIAGGGVAPIDAPTCSLKPAFDNSADTNFQRASRACLN